MNSPTHFQIRAIAATAVFVFSLAAATATSTDVIFSCEEDEGEYADTDLETDSAGNIYGTTVLGGDIGGGTVFKLSSTPSGWEHTVLYSFTGGSDGGEPYKGVTVDREGNLYGSAVTGGSGSCEGGCGVVYKLTNSGGTSRSFMLLRVARTEPQAQLEGWFCAMAVSLAQLPPAAPMEAELFSRLRPVVAESGILGRFIRSEASRTGVFPMARCCSIVWAISMELRVRAAWAVAPSLS